MTRMPVPDIVIGAADQGFADRYQDASRAVIVNADGTLTMITTPQYGEFGFPGGRKNPGESDVETLAREVLEETGFLIAEESIERLCTVEVVRQHERFGAVNLHQMNSFFVCEARKAAGQHLDAREAAHGIDVATVSIDQAVRRNERVLESGYRFWVDRDLHVLRALQGLRHDELFPART